MSLRSLYEQRPLENSYALHAQFYRDEKWLAVEGQQVFANTWQLFGHASQLLHAGDHIVGEVAGKPVIVVRQHSGELKAFYNVCRHRAGPLATCSGKAAKALHCRYHGWTYTLDGQLKAATEMQDASDFQVNDIRLTPVQVREWQRFVFVALSENVPAFEDVFSEIVERVKPNDIASMQFHSRVVYAIDCNWKVYIDNFLEGYHLPFVHPGLSKVLDYRSYDTELHPWYSLQHSPIRNNEDLYADGHAYYYFVYPNIMLNILPGRLQTNRIVPTGLNRCIVEFEHYYSTDPLMQACIDNEQQFSHQIQQEDITICEHVQRGLASSAYEAGRLNPKREAGVWHFQNLLRRAYASV